MRWTLPLFFLLSLTGGRLLAQLPDSLNPSRLSYGMNLYVPARIAYSYGVSFDVEARVHRRFSWLATLGRSSEDDTYGFSGGVPVDTTLAGRPGDFPRTRGPGSIQEQFVRYYAGAGGQVNFRIGSGDLSLGALLTLGINSLQQTLAFGDQQLQELPGPDGTLTPGPPRGLFGTATIRYRSVVQPGARLQLHYTRWISPTLALRGGIAGNLWGTDRRTSFGAGERLKYEVRDVQYQPGFDPARDNYPLPAPEYIPTPRPEQVRLHLHWNLGIVYKPTKL